MMLRVMSSYRIVVFFLLYCARICSMDGGAVLSACCCRREVVAEWFRTLDRAEAAGPMF